MEQNSILGGDTICVRGRPQTIREGAVEAVPVTG
jgi:hypothetical protein